VSKPTERELTILGILWRQGPSTVRDVHKVLNEGRDTGYTTTLKLMQIMAEKGLVERDESARTHVYRALASEEQVQNQVVGTLLDRVFAGSAENLVMRVLARKKASPEELARIREMISSLED
jgi:predicted transcriptional regulator